MTDTQTTLTATVDDLLSWGHCADYTEDHIRELAAGRENWSALDVLDLPISAGDRLWVVLRSKLIPEPLLHELACRFAEHVLPRWEAKHPEDRRPHDAVAAKRAWMRGEITDSELSTAWSAARDAAMDAEWSARAATRAATWSAAWSAARDAAMDAAWGAANAAAWGATWSAARAAEHEWQIECVRRALESEASDE